VADRFLIGHRRTLINLPDSPEKTPVRKRRGFWVVATPIFAFALAWGPHWLKAASNMHLTGHGGVARL
jgi:hypothetical protein